MSRIRHGFVSNSSSSSFIIQKSELTPSQIEKIKDHIEYSKVVEKEIKLRNAKDDLDDDYGIVPFGRFCRDDYDQWTISEYDDIIKGETWMDNFDMGLFLTEIGVSEDKVECKK